MSDIDDTKDGQNESQEKFNTPATINYDVQEVQDFLGEVFFNVPKDGAQILLWATKNKPGKPLQNGWNGLLKVFNKTKSNARACYYNIASFYPDANTLELNHRHKNFHALHAVVCDDVGTKVDPELFVERELEPTYIIESSPGNFQYGFVLDEPVYDYDQACALVQVINLAGLTDEGGVMAGKLVRLPCGVNGKTGDNQNFEVKLHTMEGPRWRPVSLVERAGALVDGNAVTWEMIQDGFMPVAKRARTQFMSRPPVHLNTADIQDMVMDYLHDMDMIQGDTGHDVLIECPWSYEHTTGDSTAYYKPLGRGDQPDVRLFHCFHEHCKNRPTKDFLEFVIANSDFRELAIREPCNIKPRNFAFNVAEDRVIDVSAAPLDMKMSGFKNAYNAHMTVLRRTGDKFAWAHTTEAAYWLHSPYRIDVARVTSDASEEKIFRNSAGEVCVNLFRAPPWTDGPYDDAKIKPFFDHLRYLLPIDEEYDWMVQMLAAKMQDMSFRGTGVVMCTPTQGVGRNTFAEMLTELVGTHNASPDLDFDTFIGSAYNEWQDSLVVVCSEALMTATENSIYRAYEALKKKIDTSNTKALINPKGRSQYECVLANMTFIFSNHMDAVAMQKGDRRLTVLTNPLTPKPNQYFADLRHWMKDNPDWPEHVYRYLRGVNVDVPALMTPLHTEAKDEMQREGQTPLRMFLSLVDEYLVSQGLDFFNTGAIVQLAENMGILNGEESRTYVAKSFNEFSRAFSQRSSNFKIRDGGGPQVRPRIRTDAIKRYATNPSFTRKPVEDEEIREKARIDVFTLDIDALQLYIADHMEL